MRRRSRILLGLSLAAFAGIVVVAATTSWLMWRESIDAEEQAVAALARNLGDRTERILTDARDLLDRLNETTDAPCSARHLRAMDRAAVGQPHVVAIGYWEGASRECGSGFTNAVDLRPPRADRIYDSGVIAWWPSRHTTVAGVPLFLMRYGRHDVAIDPRMLLETMPVRDREIGLWVEGLPMAARPAESDLPAPDSLATGPTVDPDTNTLAFRYRLGTIFPIDIVVAEPLGRFRERHGTTLALAGALGLAVAIGWIYAVFSYSRHRLSFATELRDALARGRVRAHYQPIVDLRTGRCVGAEALARWRRDTGERVAPDAFIPVAERSGLVSQVTRATLESTLRDLGPTLRDDPSIHINVNLASADLEDTGFAHDLSRRIEAAGIPPCTIALEITERSLVDAERARVVIDSLRERGHRIAIDDFGTGYSSLSYLERFTLDLLKLDKSFIHAVEHGAVTHNVLRHVIEMAASMKLAVVAEGVETRAQAAWLREQGVDFAQGFLFGAPMRGRRFRAYLRAQRRAKVYPFSRPRRDATGA